YQSSCSSDRSRRAGASRGSPSRTVRSHTSRTPAARGTRTRTGTVSPRAGTPSGTYSADPSWCGAGATTSRTRSALHGPGGEPADDVLLRVEEEREHGQRGDHGAGREQAPVRLLEGGHPPVQPHGESPVALRGQDDARDDEL